MSSPRSLPDDPRLAEVAEQLTQTGGASMLLDPQYTLVWVSPELKLLFEEDEDEKLGVGGHVLEAYCSDVWASKVSVDSMMTTFFEQVPMMLDAVPGGKAGLKDLLVKAMERGARPEWFSGFDGGVGELLDQVLADMKPEPPMAVRTGTFDYLREGMPMTPITETVVRIHDPQTNEHIGTMVLYDPGLPARVLDLVARGDHGMLERMANLVKPGRRQAAILFADLQASGEVSRRLPSAAFFKLIRALTTAIDDVVVRYSGIVGKHVGDGVTAFFLTDDLGSSSSATRASIEAAREISVAAGRVAKETAEATGLIEADSLHVNVGVHWGGTLYMGQLVTNGRLEVTALGDAVTECARIQESAREGEALASKSLIEHLSDEDAAGLSMDPDSVVYRTVGELPGASEKALRDAGGIPVTVL